VAFTNFADTGFVDPPARALSFSDSAACFMRSIRSRPRKEYVSSKVKATLIFSVSVGEREWWEMYIDHTLARMGDVLKFQFLIQDIQPALNLKWGSR